jgi:hypothetical protein
VQGPWSNERRKHLDIALLEIAEGKVGYEYGPMPVEGAENSLSSLTEKNNPHNDRPAHRKNSAPVFS